MQKHSAMKSYFTTITTLFLALLPAVEGRTCDQGLSSFQKTVYARIKKDCIKCHGGTHPKAPPFVSADPNISYEFLLRYLNTFHFDESILVVRSGNGHCKESVCEGDDSRRDMLERVMRWWDQGENQCQRNGVYFSRELPIPENLPKPNEGFIPISFELGSIESQFNGMTFDIEIQDYVSAATETRGAYRIRSPRITSRNPQPEMSNHFQVKDIKILLNGKYDPIFNAYTGISNAVSMVPIQNGVISYATPVLSAQDMILLKDGLNQPKLAVSFVDIRLTQEIPCFKIDKFRSQILPLFRKLECATCHSTGSKVFNLQAPDELLCKVTGQLAASPLSVVISPLVVYPTRGAFGHPILNAENSTEYLDSIRTWLK